MPKTLYRSVLTELGAVFLLTVAFLNAVLMMEKVLRLSALMSGVGATLFDMIKMISLIQPQLLALTVPMSLLLATLLVYGRMAVDSEIVVLKAAGMSFNKLAGPVAVLGAACFLLSMAVSFYFGPKSAAMLRSEMTKIVSVRSSLAIEEGSFNVPVRDVVMLVKSKKDAGILRDIFIYDGRKEGQAKILTAKEGSIALGSDLNLSILLKNGVVTMTKGATVTDLFFDAYRFVLHIDIDQSDPRKIELTPLELLDKAASAGTPGERLQLLLEFHRRLSLPVVCLVLVFLSLPLSQLSGKSGRLGGLAIGLGVFTLYYVLLIYGENLAIAGRLPHYAGAWLSMLVLSAAAVFLYRRELRR